MTRHCVIGELVEQRSEIATMNSPKISIKEGNFIQCLGI